MLPYSKKIEIGNATLYLGDCQKILPQINKVDLVVTSPPYDELRIYDKTMPSLDLFGVLTMLASCLKEGGVLMWNVADGIINGSESGSSFRHALHCLSLNLRLHDTMIYCKNEVARPSQNRYHDAFEYMFIFSRGAPKHFNGIRDIPTITAGSKIFRSKRQRDGTMKNSGLSGGVRAARGLRRNWWILRTTATNRSFVGHPAMMPPAMAEGHIYTWTDPGEVVLDPFMGSGTTGVAAIKLGRHFIGVEIVPKYFDLACHKIQTSILLPTDKRSFKIERQGFFAHD